MAAVVAILDFQSKQFVAIFNYKLPWYFLSNFESICFSVRKKHKIDFQDGSHLGFSIGMILAIFYLQIAWILPIKFPVSSGEEAQNKFLRWRPLRPSWISNQNNFSYLWSTSCPYVSYQVSSQLAFQFRWQRAKQIFKMAAMTVFLNFWSERF